LGVACVLLGVFGMASGRRARVSLTSSWAKLDRAKTHIDHLRAAMTEAASPDLDKIPLRRNYDATEGAVIWRIDRLVEIGDDWPLIAGDAIQNLRAALDHLMWQLAIIHLGRQPTRREARLVQYPEVTRARSLVPGGDRFLTYLRREDIEVLKRFQPYKRRKKGELHPVPKLIRLSNADKHRRLPLLVTAPTAAEFRPAIYFDCVPVLRTQPDGRPAAQWFHRVPRRPPRVGDEILRVLVLPTGPEPDAECDAQLFFWIALGKLGPVVPLLEAFGQYVANVLDAFEPVMKAARSGRT
jgi:hypothetical protein